MAQKGTRKCLSCHQFFKPDYRNRRHQRYCSKNECRKASKSASQARWLNKPENCDYFRGAEQVARVQFWRVKNPNYRSNQSKLSHKRSPLQDGCCSQCHDLVDKNDDSAARVLQDLLKHQDTIFIGFLANLCGSTLQEEIADLGRKLIRSGLDVLRTPSQPP